MREIDLGDFLGSSDHSEMRFSLIWEDAYKEFICSRDMTLEGPIMRV